MELARGIEPPTSGLQNRCSAIELRQPMAFTDIVVYATCDVLATGSCGKLW